MGQVRRGGSCLPGPTGRSQMDRPPLFRPHDEGEGGADPPEALMPGPAGVPHALQVDICPALRGTGLPAAPQALGLVRDTGVRMLCDPVRHISKNGAGHRGLSGVLTASAICSTTSARTMPTCTYAAPLWVTVGRIGPQTLSGRPRAASADRRTSAASTAVVRASRHVCMSTASAPPRPVRVVADLDVGICRRRQVSPVAGFLSLLDQRTAHITPLRRLRRWEGKRQVHRPRHRRIPCAHCTTFRRLPVRQQYFRGICVCSRFSRVVG